MIKKLPEKIVKSQSNACKELVKTLLFEVFINKRPADKVLSYYFRNNKHFGSRDRKIFIEVSFSIFRWWGWIKELLPITLIDQLSRQDINCESIIISNKSLCIILLSSSLLDNRDMIPEDIVKLWARELKFTLPSNSVFKIDMKLEEQQNLIKLVAASLTENKNIKLSILDLIPQWAPQFFPKDSDINKIISFFQRRPPMWLRCQSQNPNKLVSAFRNYNLEAVLNKTVKNAICINKAKVNLYTLYEFQKGQFEIQDLASQAIGLACNPSPGERWWDSCAGAGGKSLQLSFLMNGKGSVVATDIREYKLVDLKKRAKRASVPNIQCSPWDGKALRLRKRYKFDGVLVDAPCSCSGTWRRNPDAKWNITTDQVDEIKDIQLKILQNASTGVKTKGVLVYATCSIFYKENDDTVNMFLSSNNDFELEPFTNPITGIQTDGTMQIYPWEGNCDATFVARFRRKS